MSIEDSIDGGSLIGPFDCGSPEAKSSVIKQLLRGIRNLAIVRDHGYRCGHCAAFPCFRNPDRDEGGHLCFQRVRGCRDECTYFLQNRGSGKPPTFQITGTCAFDGSTVQYEDECHVESVKKQRKLD